MAMTKRADAIRILKENKEEDRLLTLKA